MNIVDYSKAMRRAARQNPMTAEYPPEWDEQQLEEDMIEEKSEEFYEEMLEQPDDMAEMLYSGFNDKLMEDLCIQLARMNRAVTSLAPVGRDLKIALDSMMDEWSIHKAKEFVENIDPYEE